MVRDHDGAGAGRQHDGAARFGEDGDVVARHLAGVVPVAAIEGGLAAAGLRLGEMDDQALSLKDFGRGQAHIGKNGVDEAGDEEVYGCGGVGWVHNVDFNERWAK